MWSVSCAQASIATQFFIVSVQRARARTQHDTNNMEKPAFSSIPTILCLLHSMCRYHLLLLAEDLRDILRFSFSFLPAALAAVFRCVLLKRHSFFILYLSIIHANTTCRLWHKEGQSETGRQSKGKPTVPYHVVRSHRPAYATPIYVIVTHEPWKNK